MPTSATIFDEKADQPIDSLVLTLESALPLDEFRSATDDTLLSATGFVERLGRIVDARRVAAAAEVQHRSRPTLGAASLAVRKGCRDAVELVRRVTLASRITARRRLKLGTETRMQEALSGDLFPARFPQVASALSCGELGVDAAAAIITELGPTLTRADADRVQVAEAELVAAATGSSPDSPIPCTADEIRGQACVWRVFLDEDGTLPTEEKAMARRAFSPGTYNSSDGLVHGRYALMPETHAKLGKVFDACLTPKTGPAFLPEDNELHQMICTGGTQHLTLDPNGAVISLGSEQRCFTGQQRRAITLRDGGCIIPGCTIPPSWSEIHHVIPDSEGGPTHVSNGVLLCWFHHRTIATSGWQIMMIGRVPHVKAPAWLNGDGRWHPATKSPTRQLERLQLEQFRQEQRNQDRPPPCGRAQT